MEVNYQPLYEQLGHLFYYIAAVDKRVAPQEAAALKKVVEENWLPFEDSFDVFGSDAGHYIFITFDYLLAEGTAPETAWDSFEAYYKEHNSLFTPKVKTMILQSVESIAGELARINKSELIAITNLRRLFSK